MAGYIYGGTDFRGGLCNGSEDRIDPLDASIHGTTKGVSLHRRLNEPNCEKCRKWYNAQRRAKWHEKKGKS